MLPNCFVKKGLWGCSAPAKMRHAFPSELDPASFPLTWKCSCANTQDLHKGAPPPPLLTGDANTKRQALPRLPLPPAEGVALESLTAQSKSCSFRDPVPDNQGALSDVCRGTSQEVGVLPPFYVLGAEIVGAWSHFQCALFGIWRDITFFWGGAGSYL